MLKHSLLLMALALLPLRTYSQAHADAPTPTPTIAEKITSAQKLPGYFNLYWDPKQGKLWLEIDKWSSEFLYQTSWPAGIGSNDIGLDRGQLGGTHIVRFERSGPKILLVQSNLDYRAISEDADERRAVRDSFAESALWGFTVAAEENGHVLVDATDFFLRDTHQVPQTLRRTKQGTYHLDASRSAIYLPRTKNFPLNTEVEATLTFAGDDPGQWVKQVTPEPDSITVREHHSFVQLPPPGYKPRAYDPHATGIGEWDKVSIAWGYGDFPAGTDEHAALNKILDGAFRRGLRYLTDQDARPAGSSSGLAHLWDSGANAVDELDRLMQVRAAALRRFGENNIREGAPLATMEDVLVPIYMLHRYQVEAASKLVGGMDYTFALRGDGQTPTQIIAAAEQRRALAAVLATLKPEGLALPESLLKIIPPRPPDYERGREHFKIRTSPAFDALAPAEAAAQHTLQFLFSPERDARLVEFHARNEANPGLGEVFDAVIAATWKSKHSAGYPGEIANVVDNVALYDLMALAANEHASDEVRASAALKLHQLKDWLGAPDAARVTGSEAHVFFAAKQIEQFEKDPKRLDLTPPAEPPDGPPIGELGWED